MIHGCGTIGGGAGGQKNLSKLSQKIGMKIGLSFSIDFWQNQWPTIVHKAMGRRERKRGRYLPQSLMASSALISSGTKMIDHSFNGRK